MRIKIVPNYGVLIGQKIFWYPIWPWRLYNWLRGWLPAFYAVGTYCCDTSPNQPHSWYPVWLICQRNIYHWRDQGDGCDTFYQMSVFRFIGWRYTLWAKGTHCEYVGYRHEYRFENLPVLPWRERRWLR